MTLLNILLESAPGAMNGMNIIMIVALIAIFYFFIIRPQSKKQKEIRKFRDSLKKGDRVVTAGGIYGKIREIEDEKNTIILEIAENVKIRIDKGSIYQSVQDASESQANNGNAAAK
ncbi:MAG: preprotein translocase subunit YajC [Bacteroidales bacterium]|nr:preprotein translocase subunit YajC [Bacteroidales bacterium]